MGVSIQQSQTSDLKFRSRCQAMPQPKLSLKILTYYKRARLSKLENRATVPACDG